MRNHVRTLFVAVLFLAIIVSPSQAQLQDRKDIPLSFLPSTYRIPDFIAGYHVLIIKTPDNTACMPPQARTAVLEIPEARDQTSDEMLVQFDSQAVHQVLKGFPGEWSVEIIGGQGDFEQIVSQTKTWNAEMKRTGCVTFHIPVVETIIPG